MPIFCWRSMPTGRIGQTITWPRRYKCHQDTVRNVRQRFVEQGLEAARERKTSVDWAHEIQTLLNEDCPDTEKVILVCDNLNTHKVASLYEAFEPKQAHQLAERLEIHYTPKHGSWLNVAEIELSVFTRQCLDRRIPDRVQLHQEAQAWYRKRNAGQKAVDWRFTTEDTRVKLKKLYPQIQLL